MDWHKIKLFHMLSRTSQLSLAARLLGIRASSLSRYMTKFEENLGVKLFERTSFGFLLTPKGKQLYTFADSVYRMVENLDLITEMDSSFFVFIPEEWGRISREVFAYLSGVDDHMVLDRFVDARKERYEGYDVQISCDSPVAKESSFLDQKKLHLYAHAAYLKNYPPLKCAEDLKHHALLMLKDWDKRSWAGSIPNPFQNCSSVVDEYTSFSAIHEGIRLRKGVGILPETFVPEGELVLLGDDFFQPSISFYLSHSEVVDPPWISGLTKLLLAPFQD